MTDKDMKPKARLCAMCDGWFNENDPEQAQEHRHPEPQSGDLFWHLVRSPLDYAEWLMETPEGEEWQAYMRARGKDPLTGKEL